MHITHSLTIKPGDLPKLGYKKTGIDNLKQAVWSRGIHCVLVKGDKVYNIKL